MPSVSVVIPTYNRKDAVIRAAQSALSQSLPPLEIIVVDDGSRDGTTETNLLALDPRIRYIKHSTNRGGAAARNTGIDAACGNWIAFLDSDDLWVPYKLERQFAQLGEQVDRIDVFACTNVLVCGENNRVKPYNDFPPGNRDLSEYFLIDGCTLQTSSLVVPTDLARRIRFDERLKLHQDWDFVLRLVATGAQVSYLHDTLVLYDARNDPNKVSAQGSAARTLAWFEIVGRLVTRRARHAYYLSSCFRMHRREDPIDAARTLARYTLTFPLGLPKTIEHFLRSFKNRVSRPNHI
jgi:glycosyltransferase involved in cell wall biosynthesis